MVADVGMGENPIMKNGKKTSISLLINSIYYFLNCVFIMEQTEIEKSYRFRLIVIHNNRLIYDDYFKSIKGAKIAFQKRFCDRAWRENVKAEWRHVDDPDQPWLDEKLQTKAH
jgi:hypothetical protein